MLPQLTVSIGGATQAPGAGELECEPFAAADAALYRVRQAGRDRVDWRPGA